MTNWEKYFGTPELASLTEVQSQNWNCRGLINVWHWRRMDDQSWTRELVAHSMSVDGYREWLESEAEDEQA